MKKVILSLVVVAALATASCKKDYKCVCTETSGGVTTTIGTVTIHDTKSKAKSACTADQVSIGGITEACTFQ